MNMHFNRSIPDVLGDVVHNMTNLVRKEAQLARAEMSEKVTNAATGIGMAIFGAVLAIPALVILLEAIVAGLMRAGLPVYWSALIVGGVTLIIGLALLYSGANKLKGDNLVPEKTIHQLQRDAQVAANEASTNHGINRAA
jgi:hypothetical protein